MKKKYDVAIIGAGPAGISAAIQLKRINKNIIIFEKERIGGLLNNANLVENYPGFYNGLSGIELVNKFNKHLDKLDVNINFKEIINIKYENNEFILEDKNTKKFYSNYLIIATGTKPKKIDIQGINRYSNIFYEIYSLLNIKNKRISIIGSGDAAIDQSINLSKRNKINLLIRNNKFKCLSLLKQRILKNRNITFYYRTKIIEIKSKNNKLFLLTDNNENIETDILVIAIGRERNDDILRTSKLDIEKLKNKMYIIGDVNNGIFRQVSISIGEGIKAAMKIEKEDINGNNF